MRNFKKILAVMTAVASLCASSSAFAAASVTSTDNITGTYASGVLEVKNNATSLDTAKESTILVLTEDVETVTEDKIMYIDQQNGSAEFKKMGLKFSGDELAAGTYPIRIGYYDTTGKFNIAKASLVVTADGDKKAVTIKLGDFNGSGVTDDADLIYMLRVCIGKNDEATLRANAQATEADTLKANLGSKLNFTSGGKTVTACLGDFNGSGATDDADLIYMLRVCIGKMDEATLRVNDQATDADTLKVKMGSEVQVSLPESK